MSRLQEDLKDFDPALRIHTQVNAIVTRSNNNASRKQANVPAIDVDMDCLSKLLQVRLHLPDGMFTLLDAQQLYQKAPIDKRTALTTFIQLKECQKKVSNPFERQYWIRLVHNLCHYSVPNTLLILCK